MVIHPPPPRPSAVQMRHHHSSLHNNRFHPTAVQLHQQHFRAGTMQPSAVVARPPPPPGILRQSVSSAPSPRGAVPFVSADSTQFEQQMLLLQKQQQQQILLQKMLLMGGDVGQSGSSPTHQMPNGQQQHHNPSHFTADSPHTFRQIVGELTPPPSQPPLGALSSPQTSNSSNLSSALSNGFNSLTGAIPSAHRFPHSSLGVLSHPTTTGASSAELLQRQCQQMLLARQAAAVLQQHHQQQQQHKQQLFMPDNANASPSPALSVSMPLTMTQLPSNAASSAATAASMLIANLVQQQNGGTTIPNNGMISDGTQHQSASVAAGVNPLLLVAQQIQLIQQRQQYALMEQAIKKEIYELLSSVASSNNGTSANATGCSASSAVGVIATPSARSPSVPPNSDTLSALQRAQMLGMVNLLRQREQQQQMPTHGQQTVVQPHQQHAFFQQDQHRAQQQFLSPPLTLSPSNSVHNDHHQLGGLSSVSPSTVVATPPPQECEQYQQHHHHLLMDAARIATMGSPMNLELIEKQIAAQHNELSAKEAEAVAVLAGLADGCR